MAEFVEGRERLMQIVRSLSQEQLDAHPNPSRWSIGEVVDHVILAHGEFLRVMHELVQLARAGRDPLVCKTLSDIDCRPRFIPRSWLQRVDRPMSLMTALMPTFVRTLLMRASTFPMEHPAFAKPTLGRLAFELETDLHSGLSETRSIYDANSDLDFRRLRIRHPLFGRMNGKSFLKFVVEHERSHMKKMSDTLAAVTVGVEANVTS